MADTCYTAVEVKVPPGLPLVSINKKLQSLGNTVIWDTLEFSGIAIDNALLLPPMTSITTLVFYTDEDNITVRFGSTGYYHKLQPGSIILLANVDFDYVAEGIFVTHNDVGSSRLFVGMVGSY